VQSHEPLDRFGGDRGGDEGGVRHNDRTASGSILARDVVYGLHSTGLPGRGEDGEYLDGGLALLPSHVGGRMTKLRPPVRPGIGEYCRTGVRLTT
jgi:hypothetical protein